MKLSIDRWSVTDRPNQQDLDRFYRDYVRQRKPCILQIQNSAHLEEWRNWIDALSKQPMNQTISLSTSGNTIYEQPPLEKKDLADWVQIEWKSHRTGTFGQGDRERELIPTSQLVSVLRAHPDAYLTTQYTHPLLARLFSGKEVRNQFNKIFPPPIPRLLREGMPILPFPASLQSDALGHDCLALQQVNIWMGSATETSSGLHHDFHDNLYYVVQGRKRFTLIPPKFYDKLYLYGEVSRLHDNQLLTYEYAECIRADGADIRDVLFSLWRRSRSLDAANVPPHLDEWLNNAYECLCHIRDETPIYPITFNHIQLLAEPLDVGASVNDSDDDLVGFGEDDDKYSALEWFGDEFADPDDGIDWNAPDDFEIEEEEISGKPCATQPSSFSEVPVPVLYHYLRHSHNEASYQLPASMTPATDEEIKKYRRLSNPGIEIASIELQPGDVLYLPAGWFHEVTSFANQDPLHIAFNYWFHPPTASSPTDPLYPDDFWRHQVEEVLQITPKHKKRRSKGSTLKKQNKKARLEK